MEIYGDYLGEFFNGKNNEWNFAPRVRICTLEQFLLLRLDSAERTAFAAQDVRRREELRVAQLCFDDAERTRDVWWYWPFGFDGRERRFDAARRALDDAKRALEEDKRDSVQEWLTKMALLQHRIITAVAESAEFRSDVNAHDISVVFICN